MITLTALQHSPAYITNSITRNPYTNLTQQQKVPKSKHHRQNWRLHAEAKGFSRPPPNAAIKRGDRRRDDDKKDEDDDKIPKVVWERMIARILFSVGAPLGFGVILLQLFGIVKENHFWDVPIWLPYLTTFVTFGSSALGIAYGTLSTSWDAEREGSFMGFEEAGRNWVDMWREDDGSS